MNFIKKTRLKILSETLRSFFLTVLGCVCNHWQTDRQKPWQHTPRRSTSCKNYSMEYENKVRNKILIAKYKNCKTCMMNYFTYPGLKQATHKITDFVINLNHRLFTHLWRNHTQNHWLDWISFWMITDSFMSKASTPLLPLLTWLRTRWLAKSILKKSHRRSLVWLTTWMTCPTLDK